MMFSSAFEATAAERIVPPATGAAALTIFATAAMAFLAVFALAFAATTARVADRWQGDLAQALTVRLPADSDALEQVVAVLAQTPGIASAAPIERAQTEALLRPWLGDDLPLDMLALPQLIDVVRDDTDALDLASLRLRLAGEVPDAVLDDHGAWRQPLVQAAGRLRALGLVTLTLIAGVTAAIIGLAVSAAMSANAQVIAVLRQIGARDAFIADAFVRRFTWRTFGGAALGTLAGAIAVAIMPSGDTTSFLSAFGFAPLQWVLIVLVPGFAAALAYLTTRVTAARRLKETT